MATKIIDLGSTSNPELTLPKDQKLKFTNTGDKKITVTTPKGIKRKGKKDKIRKTDIAKDKTSGRFKITASSGDTLDYDWDDKDSAAENMRNGKIKVS